MKPVTLSMKGFRSYPESATIDFAGKGLTAVLGDTGAGKSSILEGVTFALFNKSSWDGRETKPLIADKASVGSVELTFIHGGVRWRVHRTIHATNPNAGRHHLKNLDTGEEVDGATAVTKRIEGILQLGYDTFLRVGLLPQGKFDQLLTSKASERKRHLRELFGAESLVKVQETARDRATELAKLLATATEKRKGMWPDPAQTAAEYGSKASVAEALADQLDTTIGTISALQETVSAAHAAAIAARTATDNLAEGIVHEAIPTLDKLGPIADRIGQQRASLEESAAEIDTREQSLVEQIRLREQAGEGLSSLGNAEGILARLVERAEGHRQEQRSLDDRTTSLAEESSQIAADEAELNERSEKTQPLIDAADTAAAVGDDVRSRANELRMKVREALEAAFHVAETTNARQEANDELARANKLFADLTQELVAAKDAVTRAEARKSALELQNRAALIAADIHPGDDCPVCHQQVPDPFEAGGTATSDEIRKVQTALGEATALREKISDDIADAKAAVASAERTVSISAKKHRDAELEAQRSADASCTQLKEFAAAAGEVGGHFDAAASWATLTAALQLAVLPSDSAPYKTAANPIIEAIATCETAVAADVNLRRDRASQATIGIDADRKALVDRQKAHISRVDEVQQAEARENAAVALTAAEINGLPVGPRNMLPSEVIDITADSVHEATTAVAASKAEMESLTESLERVRREAADVLNQQRRLDQEVNQLLDNPLSDLRNALGNWARALGRAVDYLEDGDCLIPDAPKGRGIGDAREFVARLNDATAAANSKLTGACAAHTLVANNAIASIKVEVEKLPDIPEIAETVDWNTSQAVRPLIVAMANARKDAERLRAAQGEATAQVQQAADLDFAIAAGQARHAALEVLKKELVDAKFLGHLTTLNTKTLLGIASSLLGKLTEDQFGFAPNCDIVSRGSQVAHSANRLSGGEKFLASLALALALAELHSLSGPRLGSLFLDEGFATLDTEALHSALEVLRAQTGEDRMVMVISHLHAVAEAVDDVLWVERPTGGSSTARWLTVDERDALINADLASGLQSLT
ncbi:AAA family ATPase [Nocardia gamkensis]|uniref:Nuclease SbcCD subunit C n=1 Tax=Nocardia gamkensis TaxID=352869 RepID=A0A7X6R772_9NOCA|nr:SMC family ATPase [Nocardia gamkensis]NKY31299.1 SMC family ATPase [Nocardia gamkensis]NQE72317.1 Nuclease SbcCD subunit C [Nocardia gamkensis]